MSPSNTSRQEDGDKASIVEIVVFLLFTSGVAVLICGGLFIIHYEVVEDAVVTANTSTVDLEPGETERITLRAHSVSSDNVTVESVEEPTGIDTYVRDSRLAPGESTTVVIIAKQDVPMEEADCGDWSTCDTYRRPVYTSDYIWFNMTSGGTSGQHGVQITTTT